MSNKVESKGEDVLVVGRIVWTAGDLFTGRIKIDQNDPLKRPKLNKENQPITEFGFGLSIPKTMLNDPNQGLNFWHSIHRQAYELYPSQQVPPGFGWKFKDGDVDVDQDGQPYSNREGYKGCYVFALTTTWKPQFFKRTNGVFQEIKDGIKCGDWVEVQVNVVAHGAEGNFKAGMYLNPRAVQFVAYDKEIVNRPSADQIFGNRQIPLPPGASATPVGTNNMMIPPAGIVQSPMAAPQGLPMPGQQVQMPSPAPIMPVDPYYNILPHQHQPAPQGLPMPGQQVQMPSPAPQGLPAPGQMPPQQGNGQWMNPQGAPMAAPQGLPMPGYNGQR